MFSYIHVHVGLNYYSIKPEVYPVILIIKAGKVQTARIRKEIFLGMTGYHLKDR